MSKIDLNNMDGMYFDILSEIGNIGAGNATTALAQMIGSKVDMKVPKVELLEFSQVGEAMGGEEQLMAGIYQIVEGDISGSIMFLLEEKSAITLISKLMGSPEVENAGEFGEMELSALKEIGNIITGSYLSSLSTLTNLKIIASIPPVPPVVRPVPAVAVVSVPPPLVSPPPSKCFLKGFCLCEQCSVFLHVHGYDMVYKFGHTLAPNGCHDFDIFVIVRGKGKVYAFQL